MDQDIKVEEPVIIERKNFGSPVSTFLQSKMRVQAAVEKRHIYESVEEAFEDYLIKKGLLKEEERITKKEVNL